MRESGFSRSRPPGAGGGVVALIALLGAVACTIATPHLQAPGSIPVGREVGPLKAHLHSGEVMIFQVWQEKLETRRLEGFGSRHDRDRKTSTDYGPIGVSVDSVALLEVTRETADPGYGVGLTLLASYTVLTGTTALICVADPKSCFGSCPTFYLDDEDGQERLAAEGFSSSVARALEATDLDDLRITARGGPFSIRMRNEALETHAVRSLRLHAVPEVEGRRVLATPDGRFLAALRMLEPTRCAAAEGDCLEEVRALDGVERKSLTDPDDLAARETIELEFQPRHGTGHPAAGGDVARFGLAIAARHSFVSTFLFYQMMAYLGRDAATLLASLERGDVEALERVREVMDLPGRLAVEVLGADGEWREAGAFVEAGPLAADLQLLELPGVQGDGPVRIRMDLTRGFWRVEQVALAEIGEAIESLVVEPVRMERIVGGGASGDPPPAALEALLDPDRYLVTEPGDHFRVAFVLPELPVRREDVFPSDGPGGSGPSEITRRPNSAREQEDTEQSGGLDARRPGYRLFLESTGYYYEWMRSEWLEEESPARAAMMFLQPEMAFRQLAPAFKKLEPVMEEAFWNSRFRR